MKKISVLVLVFLFVFPVCLSAATGISKTNMGGTTILPPNESDIQGFVQYNDGSKEILQGNYVGLFINGNIIKNANLVVENDRTLLPLRLIAEYLGAKVDWAPATRQVTITDGQNKIQLTLNNKNAQINGKATVLDVAPKIFNDFTYVPVRFVAEALQAQVDYFDGVDTTKPYIVPRIRQVMIHKYPDSAKILTKEEAIEKTRAQLILAFEKKYGTYVPPASGETLSQATGGDKAMLRDIISKLSVVRENDRYYVIPVVYDFWVDKYTGEIYTFYNGQGMVINVFDPYAPGALAFAG